MASPFPNDSARFQYSILTIEKARFEPCLASIVINFFQVKIWPKSKINHNVRIKQFWVDKCKKDVLCNISEN
jgi:hypothetical protein